MAGKSPAMKGSNNDPSSPAESARVRSTSLTLLAQVKQGDRNGWARLVKLYRPLVLWWCRSRCPRPEDAEDVAQEVFGTVSAKVEEFVRLGSGSFRGWLRTITHNKMGDHLRRIRTQPEAAGGSDAHELFAAVPDGSGAESTAEESSEHTILLHSALALVRGEFESKTWEAAMKMIVDGQSGADVAQALGMTSGAVYIAKSRVLKRLRDELEELLD
jgi:RNA polymerase sigma-70 factor (ECF subfamily)